MTDQDQKTVQLNEKTLDGSSPPQSDVEVGEILEDHGADYGLQRRLGSRHLTMVGIGSSIGMGLWLGSGTSLTRGGPASIFLGYVLSGTVVWAVNQSIGELAVMYPLPSAFVRWSSKFIDPSMGFALGWATFFSSPITMANEIQGLCTVLGFWTDKVPIPAWVTIWAIVIIVINIGAVNIWGEFEVTASSIKLFWIVVVIISCIVISAGGGPKGDAIGFRYWNEMPFINGFKGFLRVMPTCIFAMSGAESSGIVAAEAGNPLKAVPAAVRSIWVRLSLFYVIGALMVTITVSPKDPNLFGGSGVNASPYVIAFRNAGVEPLAHIMNAVIFVSVLSTGSISPLLGSRTILGLGNLKMAPKIFAKCDKSGRPWGGLLLVFIIGWPLAYLNVNHTASEVFTWLSNLTSLFTLFTWGLICLSHIRFRAAWKAQGHSVSELPWKTKTFPFAAWWGLVWCMILIVVEFYLAVWPLHAKSSAQTFFANYVSVILIILLYFGARFHYKGAWFIAAKDIDLREGRRYYAARKEKKGNFIKRAIDGMMGGGSF
ncbi:putative amino acid permease [Xylona heveae TC161]|uniref:Putative amino acid permease n=1 Tax=Xylona heveae (strain CBS 132557 / TC161) TaxID=1328760 RepID=A0A165IRT1_XYLHT|nr:putative amino acid permease [Xylona heveae TC161]KZF25292.1 putative amino acid permease [Xylona heveae TC161]